MFSQGNFTYLYSGSLYMVFGVTHSKSRHWKSKKGIKMKHEDQVQYEDE